MTHHSRNIAFLPNIADACDRIAARAKAKNQDDELLAAAVSVLHDWRDYPAAVVRGAIVTAEKSGDGYAIQMADKVKYQLSMREIQARNRAKIMIPREPDDPRWSDVLAGGVALVAFGWAVLTLVLA
jgi:hypothetical protein